MATDQATADVSFPSTGIFSANPLHRPPVFFLKALIHKPQVNGFGARNRFLQYHALKILSIRNCCYFDIYHDNKDNRNLHI
jgi:hypothetical protein